MHLSEYILKRLSQINWAIADQGLVSGANFLTGIMVARFLGLEEFGRFTLATLLVLLFGSIQNAAIISPMMSIGPKQLSEETPSYYGAVTIHQIIFSAMVFAFIWVFGTLISSAFPQWHASQIVFPLACVALFSQVQDFFRRYFFTIGRGPFAFGTDTLRYLGQIAILYLLFTSMVMDSAGALWTIASFAALGLIGSLLLLLTCEQITLNTKDLGAVTSRHWQTSKWLIGSALLQIGSRQWFIYVAGIVLGPTIVGALRAAQNLMGVVHILLMGLENVVPVQASRHLKNGGPNALKKYTARVITFGELATGLAALTLSISPEYWLVLVFGEEYGDYGSLLRWWAICYLIMFLRMPLMAALRAFEQTRMVLLANLLSFGLALSIAHPLITHWGAVGAVVGTAMIHLVAVTALGIAVAHKLKEAQVTKIGYCTAPKGPTNE